MLSHQLLSSPLAARRVRLARAPAARAATASAAVTEGELLIVGPGVLGRLVGRLWLEEAPGRAVCAQTVTPASHTELAALGFSARTRADAAAAARRFDHVVFCAPPSGSVDYAAEVAAAAAAWSGSPAGALVFTSSSGVYPDCDGCEVDEKSAAVALGSGPRTDALLRAEAAARGAGGRVLRLAGLYTALRGAHSYYLGAKAPLAVSGGGLLNLLHYGDAAAAVLALLRAPAAVAGGATFLACDGAPVSRADICAAALASGRFPDGALPTFAAPPGAPLGKRMSCDATRAALGWAPAKPSFAQFMRDGGVD